MVSAGPNPDDSELTGHEEKASDALPEDLTEKVVNLCRRRGFVFPSAEIYGGYRSTYDFGPLGVLMVRNVKEEWWRSIVQMRDDVVGIDAAILSSPRIWESSGHLRSFTDPLVDCRNCKERWREDHIGDVCPNCGSRDLTPARAFNMMFKTHVGPVEEDASVGYLRPETAQGMFVNFLNVMQTSRKRPPFGIAQIGRSFRNEITPGNFIFRTREFDQMELEFFVPPDEADKWHEHWCAERLAWYRDLGIPAHLLRLRQHDVDELSHYSSATSDVEFRFPWGWGELEGVANRGDYDLRAHTEGSGVRLEYFDQTSGERYTPYVIEPAAGPARAMMAFLFAAYDEDEIGGEARTVLRLDWRLAPYTVAVLPLSRKETLTPIAREVLRSLQGDYMCEYDETQSIGRRYRRQDEIGTPLCVTVDFDSVDDRAVTIRDRDTTEQDRVPIETLGVEIRSRLAR
jgi:glycyl-tRNA synthetase